MGIIEQMSRLLTLIILLAWPAVCSAVGTYSRDRLKNSIREYIADKDARIGVAVIVDGADTIEVNGREYFPMLSVYKFPQALAVADYCRRNGIHFSDSVNIAEEEIKTLTWSPMREKYGVADLRLPVAELLEYTLQYSDNNACDVLFRMTGGPGAADSIISAAGYSGISIRSTEDEMHRDLSLCYINRCTPVAMASLLDDFNTVIRYESPEYEAIARLMETCATGTDRLAAAIPHQPRITFGHKTGTGDVDACGRLIAVNDVGYVNLPSGRRYAIAIFVSGSAYDLTETSRIIAGISGLVYHEITNAGR